jgi:hypothetical protein
MQPPNHVGPLSVRHNLRMRSLYIEYPRTSEAENILADLFNLRQVYMNISLPVLTADSKGIEVKLPAWLTGIFYLKIQDGEHSIFKRIAIQ